MQSTRKQLLETAAQLFADRGFEGVGIQRIADAHGLTKQALLHHFKTKEQLYGEVLAGIAEEFSALWEEVTQSTDDPAEQLCLGLKRLMPQTPEQDVRIRLLMRELLDNHYRAARTSNWYLKPFLKALTQILRTLPPWANATDMQALARIYQLLGIVNYYAVSGPTLKGIVGETRHEALDESFRRELEPTIRRLIEGGPA